MNPCEGMPDNERNIRKAYYECMWLASNRLINALHDTKATKKDYELAMREAVTYLSRGIYNEISD